ncbi:hypothetical protein Ancab_002897 [Ancistrocladus abbreviatus]
MERQWRPERIGSLYNMSSRRTGNTCTDLMGAKPIPDAMLIYVLKSGQGGMNHFADLGMAQFRFRLIGPLCTRNKVPLDMELEKQKNRIDENARIKVR